MEEKSSKTEISEPDFHQTKQLPEYEYLLIRLQNIKESINLIENNFLSK